jgi:hypothetical protein
MATSLDVIVDRVRSLCSNAPFAFTEAVSTEDFMRQPTGRGDLVFRVKARGGPARGQMAYVEERTDSVELEVIRAVNADYDGARRRLLKDANSLTAAIIRDGHVTSGGEYTVPDGGRTQDVIGISGATFLTLRLTLPVNYECNV